MNKEQIINELVKRIKRHDLNHSLKSFLNSKNIPEDKLDDFITEAKTVIKDKKRETLPKKNKLIFGLFLFTVITSFILFFFIFPKQNYTTFTLLCIIGAIVFVLSALMTFFYRGSWKPEQVEVQLNTKGNSSGYDFTCAWLSTKCYFLFYFFMAF